MQFRWIIAIALWTILSGPVFTRPPKSTPPSQSASASSEVKVSDHEHKR
jgi:hypothetical protein